MRSPSPACRPPQRPTAASATVEPEEGYARIVFSFDRAPQTTVRLATSVLAVSFDEPVELSAAGLARGLGPLLGVVRADPDRTAIRMSLNKPFGL